MDGSAGVQAGRSYVAPAIVDYGDLLDLTQDTGMMLHMGVGAFAAASTPTTPGGGGGPDGITPTVAGVESTGTAPGADGPSGGGAPSGGAVQGADAGGGSAGGANGGGSGDGGKLPFTGFPAAVAAAVGGGLAAAGAAARRRLGKSE